jgi:3-isopropylmalate/(R)-2-methylmalate dehydratase small subunit
MQAFTTLHGVAAALTIDNLNTDVIIRIDRLTALEAHELGPYALEALRYRADGSEEPSFVLNQPAFRSASILVGGDNFGCGSSREAAVWALMAHGIRCVVATGFGDIFYNNAFENGLLAVRLEKPAVQQLAQLAEQGVPFDVDLEQQTVTAGRAAFAFEIDPTRREALLRGLDSIGLTLLRRERIHEWQQADRQSRPWAWLPANNNPRRQA